MRIFGAKKIILDDERIFFVHGLKYWPRFWHSDLAKQAAIFAKQYMFMLQVDLFDSRFRPYVFSCV